MSEIVVTNSSSPINQNISYSLVGRPTINGSQYYEVNFTQDLVASHVTRNLAGTIWFLPDGNATLLTEGSTKYTGSLASIQADAVMLPYTLVIETGYGFTSGALNSTEYTAINETTVTIGSVKLNQTDYQFSVASLNNESSCTGLTYSDFILGMAFVPNANFAIALLLYEVFMQGGTTFAVSFSVSSFTRSS
ncbi:MAG: hypothetical protein ACYC7D_12605 [Nitrososphaerales archaeon]